jgi:hypothetical protein
LLISHDQSFSSEGVQLRLAPHIDRGIVTLSDVAACHNVYSGPLSAVVLQAVLTQGLEGVHVTIGTVHTPPVVVGIVQLLTLGNLAQRNQINKRRFFFKKREK